jgi:hypothetical protein
MRARNPDSSSFGIRLFLPRGLDRVCSKALQVPSPHCALRNAKYFMRYSREIPESAD